ncbi:hypothetical protein KIN20_010709 [Parelaphostrongylus tenuis]|uniref:Uncharacterized protein n=1 Tax=Parelaphostrongylus tenuis TaxID=148309 RepID=A0AAD5MQY6_PARTN|nr:hypothetical protein KIN20_010709 [Parelaphostrongylus tenuis]
MANLILFDGKLKSVYKTSAAHHLHLEMSTSSSTIYGHHKQLIAQIAIVFMDCILFDAIIRYLGFDRKSTKGMVDLAKFNDPGQVIPTAFSTSQRSEISHISLSKMFETFPYVINVTADLPRNDISAQGKAHGVSPVADRWRA